MTRLPILDAKTVEKVFTVKPGADARTIRLKMEGAKSLKVNSQGELEVETGLGVVGFSKPVAYQEKNGKKQYNIMLLIHIDYVEIYI